MYYLYVLISISLCENILLNADRFIWDIELGHTETSLPFYIYLSRLELFSAFSRKFYPKKRWSGRIFYLQMNKKNVPSIVYSVYKDTIKKCTLYSFFLNNFSWLTWLVSLYLLSFVSEYLYFSLDDIHTDKVILNLVRLNKTLIVIIDFRLFWHKT